MIRGSDAASYARDVSAAELLLDVNAAREPLDAVVARHRQPVLNVGSRERTERDGRLRAERQCAVEHVIAHLRVEDILIHRVVRTGEIRRFREHGDVARIFHGNRKLDVDSPPRDEAIARRVAWRRCLENLQMPSYVRHMPSHVRSKRSRAICALVLPSTNPG